jgi:small subunit ribosomal protein S3
LGQKVHPVGFRLGYIKEWGSKWFAKKNFTQLLHEDIQIRRMVKEKLFHAGVSKIEIERSADRARINIYTARPGIIIGRKGAEVDKLKKEIDALTKKQIFINIKEIKKSELDAQLVAENIAMQIQKRVAYRRAMKKTVLSALRFGALGVKVACAGRLAGSEIARREWYREGRVPLHTLRADIDYGFAEAKTTYGQIGVKVWIYKGDVISGTSESEKRMQVGKA